MALNKYMHQRNPYKTRKPNFKELAIKYPEFREKVTQNLSGKVILDFKDPEALRALTVSLLKNDFNLEVSLPVDRLIPTVPQRLNYILWLEDIFEKAKDLKGIDIGAGASCIYPLLGCKQNDWSFLASEVDDQNLMFAKKNIDQNNMQQKIKVKKVPEETILIGLVEDDVSYDFCMCNPPFYSDHLEAQGITTTRSDDRPEPQSISTASEVESISWGGEVNFVTRMIEESLVLKSRIRVYTSLLGKKLNLSLLKDELQRKKITRYSSTEFCQGRTMRWGLAWTFDDTIRFPKSAFKSLKNVKPPLTYTIPRENLSVTDYTVQAFTKYMKDTFDELQIKYNIIHSGKFYTAMNLQAKENTWSHQRRKHRQKRREAAESSADKSDESGPAASEPKFKSGMESEPYDTKINESRNELAVEEKSLESKCTSINKDETEQSIIHMDASNNASQSAIDDVNCESRMMLDSNCNNSMDINSDKDIHLVKTLDGIQSQNDINGDRCKRKLEDTDSSDFEASKKIKTDIIHENHVELEVKTNGHKTHSVGDSKDVSKTGIVRRAKSDVFDSGVLVTESKTIGSDETSKKASVEMLDSATDICDRTSKDSSAGVTGNHSSGDTATVKSSDRKDLDSKDVSDPIHCNDELNHSEPTLSRKAVIEQFRQEKEKNLEIADANKDQTKMTKYHNFDEDEDCLVMFKMVLRKEDGIITLTMEHKNGNKEAMHQIMQFFKNKFAALSPEKHS